MNSGRLWLRVQKQSSKTLWSCVYCVMSSGKAPELRSSHEESRLFCQKKKKTNKKQKPPNSHLLTDSMEGEENHKNLVQLCLVVDIMA